MKKKTIALLLTLAVLCSLTACGHEHTWVEADCEHPRTCPECGETEGEPLGHDWTEADCTHPKTCTRCGKTDGEALGHLPGDWRKDHIDVVHASRREKLSCTRCGEKIDVRTVPMESLVEGDHFLFSGNQFMQRLDASVQGPSEYLSDISEVSLSFMPVIGDDTMTYRVYNNDAFSGILTVVEEESGGSVLSDSSAKVRCIIFSSPFTRDLNIAIVPQAMTAGILRACDPTLSLTDAMGNSGMLLIKWQEAYEKGPDKSALLKCNAFVGEALTVKNSDGTSYYNFLAYVPD